MRAELPGIELVISIDGPGDNALGFHETIAKASSDFTAVDTTPDDPALMIYTSGTTGQPKGALHGHRVLLGHLPGVEMPHDFFPQPGDRFWTPADWAWAGVTSRCCPEARGSNASTCWPDSRRFGAPTGWRSGSVWRGSGSRTTR